MMLNLGGAGTATAIVFFPRSSPIRTTCLASGVNSEQLRTQLDQLHFEAENTRTKANNARLRLLRLSEAAEKLQRQAAISVQAGKENGARELLFQRKKVLQAMEKSKNRIELLDQLLKKLNEGISIKETQLIGNVASDIEVELEDAPGPVRIVSPKEVVTKKLDENENLDLHSSRHSGDQELQVYAQDQVDVPSIEEPDNFEGSLMGSILKSADAVDSLKEISSFEDFLSHLDQQLSKIEVELVTVLRFSTLMLEDREKSENTKARQTEEILASICQIRERISRIMQKVDTR